MPRLAATLVLLLQLIVAGVLPVVDAAAPSGGAVASGTAHFEAPNSQGCPRVHDERSCRTCPLLRLAGHASERVTLPTVERRVTGPSVAREARAISVDRRAADCARAPPAA